MSVDKNTNDLEFIDINSNRDIEKLDNQSETEIIGLPRLEKLIDNFNNIEENSLTLLSNNPVSLSEYYDNQTKKEINEKSQNEIDKVNVSEEKPKRKTTRRTKSAASK